MPRLQPRIWFGIATALLLIGGGIGWFKFHTEQKFFDPHNLLSRFPAEDALALSVDASALRSAGLLQQSGAPTEPDYAQFVEGTGFDYHRDLDAVAASFSRSGTYFIVRGRFDWKKLRAYVERQGGSCYQDLCRVQGSRPERHISFLPLRSDTLALAVSSNDLAATLLTHTGQRVTADIPVAPAWISVPGTELRKQDALPPEMRLTLSALSNADRVVVTFGPVSGGGIEAQLQATCTSAIDAGVLASQLRSTTALLKEAMLKDKKPVNDELATALISGTFAQNDRRVTGRWPIGKGFLDALTEGI